MKSPDEIEAFLKPHDNDIHSLYYDRDGNMIPFSKFAALFATPDYKIVARNEFPNGYLISTIWIGIDINFGRGGGRPIIFETMVFKDDKYDLDVKRYSTEEEALAGHKIMMKKWLNK